MQLPHHYKDPGPNQPERGQALVEYVLIVVLVAMIFGIALAATGGVVGNVFSNSINDLLRLTGTPIGGIPDREEFWMTVTVAGSPQPEAQIPPNTPADPTLTPSPGPSPTPTPVSPTPTPSFTPTPSLTRTPKDEIFKLPFYDSIEVQHLKWWRADANINTSGTPWSLQFYTDTNFGTKLTEKPISNPTWLKIDWTGDGAVPWLAAHPNNTAKNFSLVLTRNLELEKKTSITVRVLVLGGIEVNVGGTNIIPNQAVTGDEPKWLTGRIEVNGSGLDSKQFTPVEVRFKEDGNADKSRLYVWVQASAANPDDTRVSDGGNPEAGAYSCSYGQTFAVKGNDANTELGMWDSYAANINIPETQMVQDNVNIPRNSRCYLELRGAVEIPAGTVRPMLSFWDVWDLQGPAQAWLEVANYEQAVGNQPNGTPYPIPSLNREAVNWVRVNVHPGGTKNYNWSRQLVDLTKLPGGATLDFTKPVTFRFVIQNTTSADTQINRWYIDDVRLEDAGPERVFTLNQPMWKLDNDAEMKDFIFTGGKSSVGITSGWRLTSINKLGPSGMSFHDSYGSLDKPGGAGSTNAGDYTNYKRFTQSPTNSTDVRDMRIHSLEFNGWIQLDPAPTVDADGNKGVPVLSFYQAFHLGTNTGLEVQWTTDPFTNPNPTWKTFTGGEIRPVTATGTTPLSNLQEKIILLRDLEGNPKRIRIRFAMKVPHSANPRGDGWWIDNIRIGREETPRWIDYPFYDDAQYFASGPWRFNGAWGQTDVDGRRNASEPMETTYKRMSYSSSPGGKYQPNTITFMEGRYPLDLRNDTQTDPAQQKRIWGRPDPTCTPAPCTPPAANPANTGGAAVNPILSFYHWRDLGSSTDILVEWKRIDAPETAWTTLWIYKNGMATSPSALNTETARQRAWEYVEVSLTDVMTSIANNQPGVRDDDIVFRFVLRSTAAGDTTNAALTGNGVFIDDIRVYERPDPNTAPLAFRLWPQSETRNDPATNTAIGTGNGVRLEDDPDASTTNRFWEETWFNGGHWHAVQWESRVGVFSFHDSPLGGQNNAPDGVDTGGNVPYIGETAWFVPLDTFNVLELNQIIDLRAVDAVTEAPELYFWNRYHLGGGNIAAVQVSMEMTKTNGQPYTNSAEDQLALDNEIKARCQNLAVKQCYEQRRGWTPWETRWSETANNGSEVRAYGWEREHVNLSMYAYNRDANQFGKRIRVRFVLNQLANTNNPKDGWYIDNVTIRYRKPGLFEDVEIGPDNYVSDTGRAYEWIMEGNWGLDPLIFEGSGGSPVTFGTWKARWWDCTNCANEPGANGSYRTGTSLFLQKPDRRAPDFENTVLGINYNLGNGKPTGAPAVIGNDRYVGEFILDTPIVGSPGFPTGNRVLLVVSDDGVRVRMQEIQNNAPVGPTPSWASCIDNWKDQSPTTSTCTLRFEVNKQYRITMHYYEATNGAALTANIGEGRYSFSDSPQQGGSTAPDKEPLALANTSMRLNLTLDMRKVEANQVPILVYKTKYRFGPKTFGRVEVSVDGGFTWAPNDPLKAPVAGYTFSEPNITNAVIDPNPSTALNWQTRTQNLSSYRGAQILIRFRLDRQLEHCARTIRSTNNTSQPDSFPLKCASAGGGGDEFIKGFWDGWWISNVTVTAQ
jgi:Flp pilus assembly pilin Flp